MPKTPQNGRCPHCQRVQPIVLRGGDTLRMRDHVWRNPVKDKVEKCPGIGRKPKPGTAK